CLLNTAGGALPRTRVGPSFAETTASILARLILRGIPERNCSGASMDVLLRLHSLRAVYDQIQAVIGDVRRTFGPHRFHQLQPLLQPLAKFPPSSISSASELIHQAEVSEDRNALGSLCHKTSVRQPHEQVEGGG